MTDPDTSIRTDADAREETQLAGGGEAVTLQSVSKTFGDLSAVEEIDLEVQPGELLVLLGPSGCGKTTTLRMIAGLEPVSEGSIHIGDDDVTEMLPQRRDVSMVFQNYALYPHKTVRNNLRFPLGKTDLDEEAISSRVEAVASLLEIDDLLSKDPDQLSGGQRQRVALGRTIIREPRVFLMDEPLSNLDATLRVQTRAQIRDLQQRLGTTTVYVTHDQEEALSIADRVAIMHDGQIEQTGSPESVYTDPVNEFVAGFLGDPSMNMLDVTEAADGDRSLFPADPVSLDTLGVEVSSAAVRLGVRPEDVYVDVGDTDHGYPEDVERVTDPVAMTVGVREPLGHGYEATLKRGAVTLAVTTDTLPAESGERVMVTFDRDRIHTFAASGATC